jgi:ATP sulfurylase
MKQSQAALVTGYSANRISILLDDPAFSALVEDYRTEAKAAFADLAERMNNMSLDAIELLQERLHDNPEIFSIPMLLDVVKAFADRTGHGPGQEVHLKMDQNFIDRPPRENFDEWKERRARELGEGDGDSLVPATRTTN